MAPTTLTSDEEWADVLRSISLARAKSSTVAPVTTKRDMYTRLVAGEFGNTLRRWFNWSSWFFDRAAEKYELWGVQHASIAGFPGTRLDVPRRNVARTIQEGGFGDDYVISPMIHQIGAVRWEGDVCRRHDGPGLLCSGNLNPANGSWRRHMLAPKRWEGSAANILLRHILNENSYDDLMILLDTYPDHIVEFSALDVCFGTVPGRNAIVWELRRY